MSTWNRPLHMERIDPALTDGPRSFDLRHWLNSGVNVLTEYAHTLALRYKEPGSSLGAEE